MYNVTVTFANGETYSPRVRLRFDANTRTRVIDLPGMACIIRGIDFQYRSIDRRPGGRAVVHVFARR